MFLQVGNPSKMRVDLRLYCELLTVAVVPLKTGLPVVGHVLTTLVAQDKQDSAVPSNTAIIISFCKHCGEDYAGLVPTRMKKLLGKYSLTLPASPTSLNGDKQRVVRGILSEYMASLTSSLLSHHHQLAQVERANRRLLLTRGELPPDRAEQATRLGSEVERLLALTEQMSEALGEEMVQLPR